MATLSIVFMGATRSDRSAGYGIYSLTTGNSRKITKLEFGPGMSAQAAQKDTLLTALEVVAQRFKPEDTHLTIQCADTRLINEVRAGHYEQVTALLRKFDGWKAQVISEESVHRLLG